MGGFYYRKKESYCDDHSIYCVSVVIVVAVQNSALLNVDYDKYSFF